MNGFTVDVTTEKESGETIIRFLVKRDGQLKKSTGFMIDDKTSKDEFIDYLRVALNVIDEVK